MMSMTSCNAPFAGNLVRVALYMSLSILVSLVLKKGKILIAVPFLYTCHSLFACSQSDWCTNVAIADWKGPALHVAIVSRAPRVDTASAMSFFENCWGMSHTLIDLVLVSNVLGGDASRNLAISLSLIDCVHACSASS